MENCAEKILYAAIVKLILIYLAYFSWTYSQKSVIITLYSLKGDMLIMESKVLAKIGNREITTEDIRFFLRNVDPRISSQFAGPEGVKQLLAQLSEQELFYLDAVEKGLDKETEFVTELERVKSNLLKQYALSKLINSVTVNEVEMKKYYNENKEEFVEPESIKASHILVNDEDTANKIIAELENGKKFEDAAKEYSICPSKENGGDLGFFPRGRMVPEFEVAAFALEKGEITKTPVKTKFGYHIIKLTGRRDAMELTFSEAEERVKSALLNKKQQEEYYKRVEELKQKYEIKFFI